MLQLKRFEYNPFTEKNEKILSRYTYPESFDFSEIVHKPTPIYKLYAVLVHQGEKASSGHYYAYIRLKDKWYKFNDEIVKESCEREVF
jgi:ubiquitin C-terminal hydrolase